MLNLGALDFLDNFEDILTLPRELETMGFSRYWLTEHPPQPSPITIAALILSKTTKIKLGTAGIQLKTYAPMRAAFDFLFLEKCFPGRVDVGFCSGNPPVALREYYGVVEDKTHDDLKNDLIYTENVKKFLHCLRINQLENYRSYNHLSLVTPPIWGLGTGYKSAMNAAENGIGFCYSLFHKASNHNNDILTAYRNAFLPETKTSNSETAISLAFICQKTENKAKKLLMEHKNSDIRAAIYGSPQKCAEFVLQIVNQFNTKNVILLDLCKNYEDKLMSYKLINDELLKLYC